MTAVFVAHGGIQVFAEAAVGTGFGLAGAVVVVGLLRRVRWREVAALTAIAMFLGSVLDETPLRRWL